MSGTALLALFLSDKDMTPTLMAHSYWIILTILIVMKPGFALTRQRNGWRLTGTLLGCAAAFALFGLTKKQDIYLAVLIASDRKRVVEGKRVSVRIGVGGRRLMKKKT